MVVRNHPAITDPARIGELLRAIDGYHGQRTTEYALKLAPRFFARPGEFRKAEWTQFDLARAEWRENRTSRLSHQAAKLLRELHPPTGGGRYLAIRSAAERSGPVDPKLY